MYFVTGRLTAEEKFPFDQFLKREMDGESDLAQVVSHVASLVAEGAKAVAIVTPAESGSTGCWVSRLRSRQPIFILSRHLSTVKRLNLCWGVYPVLVPDWKDSDDISERAKRMPQELGTASTGDRIIISGVPLSIRGTTNLIKVEVAELNQTGDFPDKSSLNDNILI